LYESKIVSEDVFPKCHTPFLDEILVKHIHAESDLHYDSLNDELFNESYGFSTSCDWINDHLPDVFIDIDHESKVEN
jgi:hypothetical protein